MTCYHNIEFLKQARWDDTHYWAWETKPGIFRKVYICLKHKTFVYKERVTK
ncbi:MAG: hypothetical protein U1D67_06700 [Dehalococcoidia bacterium]|nr:hypothetical protein [Dehalococcoidia bacterium]